MTDPDSQNRYTAAMNGSASSPRFHLGIVTGLGFEADIARAAIGAAASSGSDTVTVACHGPGQARAHSAAGSLLDVGATALLSFGVAGGCNPELPSGTVVLSTGVRDIADGGQGELLYTNREWQRRIKFRLLGTVLVEEAMIASAAVPVTGAADKRLLHADLNAAAVDMESAAIAHAAIEAGVPFMALRAILDTADTTLPPAALAGLGPDGDPQVSAVIRALCRRPQDLAALIRLGFANAKARRALERAAAAAAPLFGAV
jgi:adenosylhomocysteine nucleosidase